MTRFCFCLLALLAAVTMSPASSAALDPRCAANSDYVNTCGALSAQARCSRELTDLCCTCQEDWQISFAYCGFTQALYPTPTHTPTPTLTATPTLTVTPTPTMTPTPLPGTRGNKLIRCIGGFDANGDGILDGGTTACLVTVCVNGLDDDNDGSIDFPSDPGCLSEEDNSETDPSRPACDNGVDDDNDSQSDMADSGCSSPSDTSERPDLSSLGCTVFNAESEVSDLKLTARRNLDLTLKSLAQAEKAATKARNKALAKKLASLVKQTRSRLSAQLGTGDQTLGRLPLQIATCPAQPICIRVDLASDISIFGRSMSAFAKLADKALAQAARLSARLPAAQAKQIKSTRGKVSKAVKNLNTRAGRMPAVHSDCN